MLDGFDRMPDYNDLFLQHDAEQEKLLENLPKCTYCNEKIQDEYYFEINGEPVCEECLIEHHRKWVDDFAG